ncbi:MAG TPA: hypothetical protein DCK95_03355 [Anaerolineaceae bacterium]|nr:hypothetical protein [Anaerolineaceae bacterium]
MKPRAKQPLPDFSQIPADGLKIEGMETSSGIKGLGSIEFARNRFDPYLVLFEDHLVMNVMRLKEKPYSEIERMILLPRRKPYALRLYFKHDHRTFSTTILNRELLQQIYDFLLVKNK